MFLSRFISVCRFSTFTKSETIARKIPFHRRNNEFSKVFIDDLNKNDLKSFEFPMKTFNTVPNHILKNLFNQTYETMQRFKPNISSYLYSRLLNHYIRFDIDFELNDVLKEIDEKKIKIDETIFRAIVNKCKINCDINTIEKFSNATTDKYNSSVRHLIYGAYIRAGNEASASEFVNKYNLDENSTEFLLEAAKAYAVMHLNGKMHEKLNCLATKKQNDKIMLVFEEAVKSNFMNEELLKILDYISNIEIVKSSILNLNRNGYYKQALMLVSKYKKSLNGENLKVVILSFNNTDCPVNIYKDVLDCLINLSVSRQMFLFSYLSFESSLNMCNRLSDSVKPVILFEQLGLKLISEFSKQNLNRFIAYGLMNFTQSEFNQNMFFVFHRMVKFQSIDVNTFIEKYCEQNGNFLMIAMLYVICNGDISGFQALRNKHGKKVYPNFYMFAKHIAHIVLMNYTVKDLDAVITEIKLTYPHFSKFLVQQLTIQLILSKSADENVEGIKEAVKFAENYNVKILPHLLNGVSKHRELFEQILFDDETSLVKDTETHDNKETESL